MVQLSAPNSADSERAELENVLLALARYPRLANLLNFLAQRYFDGRSDEINEYNIATEVFGRSKTTFDASQDSIARVEAYRLRKKLKEYYDSSGKDHLIEISLPSGSYVPVFKRRVVPPEASSASAPGLEALELKAPSAAIAVADHAQDSQATKVVEPHHRRPPRLQNRYLWYWIAAVAALVILGFGAFRLFWRSGPANQPKTGDSQSFSTAQPTPQNAAQVPLRLLAGYQGSPKIDSAGAYWQADQYYSGSAAFARPAAQVSRTSDPMLYEHWRTGDFSYNIPLAPGPYELHLFFVASPPEDSKTQFFNVSANGHALLTAFNIAADALGTNIADERVFKDIYPDKDGFLRLKFAQDRTPPTVNAIEILPGLPHRQLPVRVVMQPIAVTDHNGNLWHPDNYFESGTLSDPPRQVSGTPDPSLYAQERYGHFRYSIPVDTRSRYTLVLHFAELYWVPDASGSVGVGSREFNVYCNGTTLLENFDIFKEVGSLHALTKTFSHVRPSPEGKLDLTFEPIVNYATISAIEVIDESE
ncbi:MAG TPA: malectin domain-containing carbohydrate-binding protein [Terracidiphilus sp.]|jgi:hypothetical protein